MASIQRVGTNKIGWGIIEIQSVPSIKIVLDKYSDSQTMAVAYKKEMGNLLTQVYRQMLENNIPLELLLTTHIAVNQTYSANIRIFLLVRVVGNNDSLIEKNIHTFLQICKTTLDLQKYEYDTLSYDELLPIIRSVSEESICAIVKMEKAEQGIYSFEQIPVNETDMDKIINTLIKYPDSAVSFQLIPTSYTPNELQLIDSLTLSLDNQKNGRQATGNINFSSLVGKIADTYKYYSQNKNKALFKFNILIYGKADAVQNIRSSIYGQLNAELDFIDLPANEVKKNENLHQLPWFINDLLQNKKRIPFIQGKGQVFKRLPYIITFEEAAEFFRLPFGNEQISAGLKVNESVKKKKTFESGLINTNKDSIEVGILKSSGNHISFSLKDLTKHMLIVGTPGSGKTTFSVSLLDRLWKKYGISFLVIEPAKNEYRALVQSIPDLQVFTPGKNEISPFVFNPFVPPENVKLEAYKSTLKTAFAAAVSMSTPLDKIFEESINNCYSDFRWLDNYTIASKGKKIFNISDFIKCFQETFDKIGYTGDTKNIGRAGVVRLNSLVNMFDNYYSIPIKDILTKPTIIELAAIENSDQKALIIALLLLSIYAFVNANYLGEGDKLRNVILLEEAHCLLDAETNVGTGQLGEANPAKIAQGLVKRMLAEIRSYGVGLVIADQSPRKVGIDVVALTDIKMAFRLVEATDRQILADSTGMAETQTGRLAKLKPGEAFFFFNRLDEPEEIVTPNYRIENDIPISLKDEWIKEKSAYWNDKRDKLRPYPECQHVACCKKTCDYSRRILSREIARRLFIRYFKPTDKDLQSKELFKKIGKLIVAELNDEPFSLELLVCVKVHLWRKIIYDTLISVSDEQIKHSLEIVKFDSNSIKNN